MRVTGRPSSLEAFREQALREFHFTEADFAQAVKLFNELTGMSMVRRKRDLIYGRLIRRLRATHVQSFREYLELVRSDRTEAEQFVNALTTNLTSFFREAHHFPILAEHALAVKPRGHYRVWCAAASTGEEPYSIAITLSETYKTASPPAEIVATDLDTNVLEIGRTGIYDAERTQSVDPGLLRRHFLRGKGNNAGRVRVKSSLQAAIKFAPLNLLADDWNITGKFDAIFVRNVLIYFSRSEQMKTVERLTEYLTDDGLLFAGHSESLFYATAILRSVGPTTYCRVGSRLERGAN